MAKRAEASGGRRPGVKTSIKGGYIVGFNGAQHKILHDGEVVFEADRIVYVGRSSPEAVVETIDAGGKLWSAQDSSIPMSTPAARPRRRSSPMRAGPS